MALQSHLSNNELRYTLFQNKGIVKSLEIPSKDTGHRSPDRQTELTRRLAWVVNGIDLKSLAEPRVCKQNKPLEHSGKLLPLYLDVLLRVPWLILNMRDTAIRRRD